MKNNTASSQNPGCLAGVLRLFGFNPQPKQGSNIQVEHLSADPEPDVFPYRLRDDFLSPAEKSFYQVIKGMMGAHLAICPKVSLADIFFVVRPNENKSAYNRINRKHVDYLICDPKTMNPLFAIELDDSSHQRQDRIERDAFVEDVFKAADLPLVHVPVRAAYNTTELGVLFKQALDRRIAPTKADVSNQPNTTGATERTAAQAPFCPKCGVPMVLRISRTGNQAGRQFYGCSNYPKCRMILAVGS